jgi:tetratricopeptide (TPR) repeat protein
MRVAGCNLRISNQKSTELFIMRLDGRSRLVPVTAEASPRQELKTSLFTPEEKNRLRCPVSHRRMWLPMLCNDARAYSHQEALQRGTVPNAQYGEELLVIGRDFERIELLQKSPKWERKNREIQTELADRLSKAEQDPRTRQQLDKDFEETPNDVGIRLARTSCILKGEATGVSRVSSAEYQTCLEDLNVVLAFVPTYVPAQDRKVACLIGLERYPAAAALLQTMLHSRPTAEGHFKLAQVYSNQRRWHLSFAEEKKAIQLDPTNQGACVKYVERAIHRGCYRDCSALILQLLAQANPAALRALYAVDDQALEHASLRKSPDVIQFLAEIANGIKDARQGLCTTADQEKHKTFHKQELRFLYALAKCQLDNEMRTNMQAARQLALEGLQRDHGVTEDEVKAQRRSEKRPSNFSEARGPVDALKVGSRVARGFVSNFRS